MLQVVQYQKNGEIKIEDFPLPFCPKNGILVQTEFSLISAGTEKFSVSTTQSSLLQRAKKQPDQVKLVMDFIKKEGVLPTMKRVMNKLDSFKTLGYSASGIVIETDCDEFSVGDRVAVGGAGYAVHAEILAIPKNLAVKINSNVDSKDAAYTTVGTIALQGVRQADVRLGETVAVIGLGLLGQITVQLLKASGCKVIGLDINEGLFEKAKSFGCDATFASSFDSVNNINSFTRGLGCDSVIITASTTSNDPMNLALKIARKKGKVIIVGAIGMDIPRSPFYEKEIDIRISCSYGPGRYDSNYEELGNDYPSAYVRWTENRNMQSFVDLLSENKLDVKSLTTHVIKVNDASKAYDLITGKISEPYLGILIEYPKREESLQKKVFLSNNLKHSKINIGFIGAGNFAQSSLLPTLKNCNVELIGVSTATPVNTKTVADKFGFLYCTTNSDELINDKETNVIFCASKHDSHADYVIKSLKQNKPVFVEKPLAITPTELAQIELAIQENKGQVMVGFNRRFSETFLAIEKFFKSRQEPFFMNYRVNAGFIPKSHWVNHEEHGGRIIGEVCHFIDCMIFLTKSHPIKVFAESISSNNNEVINHDTVSITIKFSDGSTGNIAYLANGDSVLPKEYLEVFCNRSIAVMNDFKTVNFLSGGVNKKQSFDGRKGHREEIQHFIKSVENGNPMPISFDEIRAVSLTTFAVLESLATGLPVNI